MVLTNVMLYIVGFSSAGSKVPHYIMHFYNVGMKLLKTEVMIECSVWYKGVA